LNPLDRIERFQITCSSSFPGLTLTLHPPLSPARSAERLPSHPPLRPVRRNGPSRQHRARSAIARCRGGRPPTSARRGRESGRRRFAYAALPVLRRPDDRRRDIRRPAPLAFPVAEPDQDRQLMTVASHPASQRRPLSPPAARRNMNVMPARPPQPSVNQCEPLPAAHRRHQRRPTSAPQLKTPPATCRRRLARRPSVTHKSP